MTTPEVSIVILNWNSISVLQPCLAAIQQNTSNVSHEIIVWDNGSTETGIEEVLKPYPHIKFLKSELNHGFARGNNLAAKHATGKYVVFLNSDTVPQPDWLLHLLNTIKDRPECALVGPKLLNPDGSIQYTGAYFVPAVEEYMSPFRGYPPDTPGINEFRECEVHIACCLLVKIDLFQQVGGFDETYQHGHEDYDLCLAIRSLGYKLMYCPLSEVVHYAETSTKKIERGVRQAAKKNNAIYFNKKWRMKIAALRVDFLHRHLLTEFVYYNNPRDDIFEIFPGTQDRVLEIGCAGGIFGKRLKDTGKANYVCGIEINPIAADLAKNNIDQVFQDNIESAQLSLPRESFDAVVLADVIEHLVDPWDTLFKASTFLKPGGLVVASIPNIRHYRIITQIINDEWLYAPSGIMDYTHLRFFGLSTIQKLFEVSGFKIIQIHRKQKGRKWHFRLSRFYKKMEDLTTLQYIIIAKKV